MRYLLVVGFACEVYRREPRARIYVGDQLIDEFYIKHHKNKCEEKINNFCKNFHKLEPYSPKDFQKIVLENLPPLRFYEIDIDKNQKKLKISIFIENNDNNYTNGFITKNTLIKLRHFYFFPLHKKYFLKLEKIITKKKFTKNYAWYCRSNNKIFDLSNSFKWQGKNQYIKHSCISYFNIGGNGSFFCELIKKYNFFILKIDKIHRIVFDFNIINYILNKYKQHENQRNTD